MKRRAIFSMLLLFFGMTIFAQSGLTQSPATDGNSDSAFPAGDALRLITEPVKLGFDGFSSRLEKSKLPNREPLGLVLAGGSARAYAHIGVLGELESAGIRPDFIVANSMGAVIGMLYAAGISPDMIASIIRSVPIESCLDFVLPGKGGVINAEPFVAVVRMFVGDLDLSETEIPIIVTTEDLRTRRTVEIAEGDFSKVMAATFAIPAIFEPVPLGDYLLVDGGATNIVPVAIAAEYSSRLIVSTTLYDKEMNYGNMISVLNRAFDIGKSRAGIRDIFEFDPFVIRNKVENISYMEFANPGFIIEEGRISARAEIPALKEYLGGAYAARDTPATLAAARSGYDRAIPEKLNLLAAGALPPVRPLVRYKPRVAIMSDYEPSALDLDSQPYMGVAAAISGGKLRCSISSLFGLAGDAERQWGIAAGLLVNPADTLKVAVETRLWGDFVPWSQWLVKPAEIEGLAAIEWTSSQGAVRFKPRAEGSLSFMLADSSIEWDAGTSLETSIFSPVDRSKKPGPASFIIAQAGAFAGAATSIESYGPEWKIKTGVSYPGLGALRVRHAGRYDLSGNGTEFTPGAAFRATSPAGKSALVSVVNAELAWAAPMLEFSLGEMIIVKNIEIGPYFDLAWGGSSQTGAAPGAYAFGAALSLTSSFVGLQPLDISAFGGVDQDFKPVFGIRSSRLFPAVK